MNLYDRVRGIVQGQFNSCHSEPERVDAISHLLTMEISVIATNFAVYAREHRDEWPVDLLDKFIEAEFPRILSGKKTS